MQHEITTNTDKYHFVFITRFSLLLLPNSRIVLVCLCLWFGVCVNDLNKRLRMGTVFLWYTWWLFFGVVAVAMISNKIWGSLCQTKVRVCTKSAHAKQKHWTREQTKPTTTHDGPDSTYLSTHQTVQRSIKHKGNYVCAVFIFFFIEMIRKCTIEEANTPCMWKKLEQKQIKLNYNHGRRIDGALFIRNESKPIGMDCIFGRKNALFCLFAHSIGKCNVNFTLFRRFCTLKTTQAANVDGK